MGEKNNATYLHSALIVAWRGEIRARRLGMYCMNVSFHISQERRRQNWKLWKDHVEQKTWSSRPSGKSWRWPLWRWECERFGFFGDVKQLRLTVHCGLYVFWRKAHTVVRADWAALVVGNDGIGAGHFFTHHFIAEDGTGIAHADLAWHGLPHVPVGKHLTLIDAGLGCACRGQHKPGQGATLPNTLMYD